VCPVTSTSTGIAAAAAALANSLHAEDEAVGEQHLAKRTARPPRLHAPAQRARGQAVLQQLVERVDRRAERLGDGSPDGRAHGGREDLGQAPAVLPDRNAERLVDYAGQSQAEPAVEGWIAGSVGEG
jgi:hypothetical protein